MKILVYTTLNTEQKNQLKDGINGDIELFFKSDLTEESLFLKLAEADIVLGNVNVGHLTKPHPNLKFWQLDSAGFDQYQHINLNIPVANMGTFYAKRCAESIVAGVIGFYRGINSLVRLQTQKNG